MSCRSAAWLGVLIGLGLRGGGGWPIQTLLKPLSILISEITVLIRPYFSIKKNQLPHVAAAYCPPPTAHHLLPIVSAVLHGVRLAVPTGFWDNLLLFSSLRPLFLAKGKLYETHRCWLQVVCHCSACKHDWMKDDIGLFRLLIYDASTTCQLNNKTT